MKQPVRVSGWAVALLFAASLLVGCGEQPPDMDTTTVSSPVGRPGVCAQCDKKIENVTESHLITVRGNQYIVCDEKCAGDLKEWLAKQ